MQSIGYFLGIYVMKNVLIKWLLPLVIDMAINALNSLSRRSDNEIDDYIVAEILRNRDSLIAEIKANL